MKEEFEYENAGMEGLPIIEAEDHQILMHRDVHFGGKFDIMIDYYINEGKGVHPDFDLERIVALAKVENGIKQNLAPLFLSGVDAEKIAEAKKAYKKLRDVYNQKLANKPMHLIADLILSEEIDPVEEIEAIVAEKDKIVPSLITLLKTEEYYDSLYPGYGTAPALAARCLGLIGDKRAIISLFESIGEGDFFDEDMALDALKAIGEPAKEFLLRVLQSKPYNQDNEKAATALVKFKEDEQVSKTALNLLKDPLVQDNIVLSTYLILSSEGLKNPVDREDFKSLKLPHSLTRDVQVVLDSWKSS